MELWCKVTYGSGETNLFSANQNSHSASLMAMEYRQVFIGAWCPHPSPAIPLNHFDTFLTVSISFWGFSRTHPLPADWFSPHVSYSDSWEGAWMVQLTIIASDWKLSGSGPLNLHSACGPTVCGSRPHLWSIQLCLAWSCDTDLVTYICSLSGKLGAGNYLPPSKAEHAPWVANTGEFGPEKCDFVKLKNILMKIKIWSLCSNFHKAKNPNSPLSQEPWKTT